jgi:hypothetical protein
LAETGQASGIPSVNKGGTVRYAPFADISAEGVFYEERKPYAARNGRLSAFSVKEEENE